MPGILIIEDEPELVRVLRSYLEQAGYSVLTALRYTPAGGQVGLSFDLASASVTVRVHDSGPGIPAESLSYIFGRFYRVDKSRTRLEGGSGLGLAIARQLARAHHGDLTVTNHPSGGAVFTLTLPADGSVTA